MTQPDLTAARTNAAGPLPAVSVPVEDRAGSGGQSALYDLDPHAIADLVLACPAVVRLSGGPSGGAATYLPGQRLSGVQIGPDTVEVHVVAAWGVTVAELAGQVRAALSGQVRGRNVDIVVEDIVVEDIDADVPLVPLVPPVGQVRPTSAP